MPRTTDTIDAPIEEPVVFRVFTTGQAAIRYRHAHGTGGWVLEREGCGTGVLFPNGMTPTQVFAHPLSKKGGKLFC